MGFTHRAMWYECPQTPCLGIKIKKWLIKLVHTALVLTTAREPAVVEMALFLPAIVPSAVPTHLFWKQKTSIHHFCNKWGPDHAPKVTSQGFPPSLWLLNTFSINGRLKCPIYYLNEILKMVVPYLYFDNQSHAYGPGFSVTSIMWHLKLFLFTVLKAGVFFPVL